MHIEIAVEGSDALADYASVPIAYRIVEVLDPDAPSPEGGLLPFRSTPLDAPILKDYDAHLGNHPLEWPARFDVRDWGFLAARSGNLRVGGAVVVADSPECEVLERRNELALLWDIRVAPAARNHGIGTALLAAAEAWARTRGSRMLKVETQNTNVPACRFYASRGFKLESVNRGAYPDLPDEIQLCWYKEL